MLTEHEYKKFACQCIRWADETRDPWCREAFLALAVDWAAASAAILLTREESSTGRSGPLGRVYLVSQAQDLRPQVPRQRPGDVPLLGGVLGLDVPPDPLAQVLKAGNLLPGHWITPDATPAKIRTATTKAARTRNSLALLIISNLLQELLRSLDHVDGKPPPKRGGRILVAELLLSPGQGSGEGQLPPAGEDLLE